MFIVGPLNLLTLSNKSCFNNYAEISQRKFHTFLQAAQFLSAARAREAFAFQIQDIGVEGDGGNHHSRDKKSDTNSNMIYLAVGLVAFAMLGLLFGVLVSTRKRARGITWFPEGFLRTSSSQRRRSRRKGPDGQEMR